MEENEQQNPEKESEQKGAPDLGKFKDVTALLRAYGELEAEFTRRSQKLKALEETAAAKPQAEESAVREEDLYRMVNENEGVRARILSDYFSSHKGVPLLTNSGVGVTAPKNTPKSISEAGSMALSYFRDKK